MRRIVFALAAVAAAFTNAEMLADQQQFVVRNY
jgi:hypothetical protein